MALLRRLLLRIRVWRSEHPSNICQSESPLSEIYLRYKKFSNYFLWISSKNVTEISCLLKLVYILNLAFWKMFIIP